MPGLWLRENWEARLRCLPVAVMGAGTVLNRCDTDLRGRRALVLDGHEERLLALLAIAYGEAIGPVILDHIRRAAVRYARGEPPLP